jgi:hypothetical protein
VINFFPELLIIACNISRMNERTNLVETSSECRKSTGY